MRTKAKVVIECADDSIIGTTVFTGKNAAKEAKAHFVALVLEDMSNLAAANGEEFDPKEAMKEAAEKIERGNYTSEAELLGDQDPVDILIVDAD
jgi:hypothetical protein